MTTSYTVDYSIEVSEDLRSDDSTLNSTVVTRTASMFRPQQTVSAQLLVPIGILISSIGIAANAVVLAVLVRARREFGSSVHTLISNQSQNDLGPILRRVHESLNPPPPTQAISNQSAMDLFACIFAMVSYISLLTHGYR